MDLFFKTYLVQVYFKIKGCINETDYLSLVRKLIDVISEKERSLFDKVYSLHYYFVRLIVKKVSSDYSKTFKERIADFYSYFSNEIMKLLKEFNIIPAFINQRDRSNRAFLQKIRIYKFRFKQAYNPCKETSMEIFAYHEKLKKWVEIGNEIKQ